MTTRRVGQGTFFLAVSLVALASAAAEPPALFGDLEPLNAVKLSKDQLDKLLPGAKMSRVIASGSSHMWTNDPGGTTVVSTDNRSRARSSTMARPSSHPGKWYVSPDGRFCMTIEWGGGLPVEDWCRYVFETTDGYYASKTDHDRSEKVYRLQINGR